MRVDANNLYSEMQAMGRELRGISPTATEGGLEKASEVNANHKNFASVLEDALNNVNNLQGEANDLRTRFDLGDRSVSIGDVMIAAQKSSVAFDATVQVRNKAVEAFKEIMSMPV